MKNICSFILLLILFSCSAKVDKCNLKQFQELNLTQVASTLKIPKYIIVDSNKYGFANLLRYELQSMDSSLVIFVNIKTYEHDTSAMGNFRDRFESKREGMGVNVSKEYFLVDTVVNCNGTELGLLKYFDKSKNRYEGFMFYFKDSKMISISLFEENKIGHDQGIMIDCIFKNIEIY